jgi:hypothetical protein
MIPRACTSIIPTNNSSWILACISAVNVTSSLPNNWCSVRFQVLTAASMMFRAVFWVVLPCKMIVDRPPTAFPAYRLPPPLTTSSLDTYKTTILLSLGLFIPDDGGSTHLWNVDRHFIRSTIILHGSTTQKTALNINWCSTAIPTCIEFLKMIETIKLMSAPHSQNICHNGPSITLSKSLLDPLDSNNFTVTVLKQNIRQRDWQCYFWKQYRVYIKTQGYA